MPDIFISPEEEKIEPQNLSEETSGLPEKAPKTEPQRADIQGHSHNKLASFCLYPDDVDFETRDKKEQIVLLVRRHMITNLKWVLTTLLLLMGPTVIGLLGVFEMLPLGFPLVISLAWYLVTSAYAIENFLDWYFSVQFITTSRVVDVDFYNLIDKRVSDAELEKIQDVSYTTGGFIRTMFNFGNVLVQTAAEVSEFEFEDVPNPEKVAKIINDLTSKM